MKDFKKFNRQISVKVILLRKYYEMNNSSAPPTKNDKSLFLQSIVFVVYIRPMVTDTCSQCCHMHC